jgi:thiaminase (transcriptional activator TenA)
VSAGESASGVAAREGAAPATLFERLKASAAAPWKAYTGHAFVHALADASLPEACFRHYLTQDYLFLIHFARAYGLAVFKAETLADIRHAAAGLSAMVDQEMGLHVAYCRRWQLDEAEMAAAAEADATIAYTRFVLERGLAGDLLDLYVALAPCIVGYAEIGRHLKQAPTTRLDGNPYGDWIEMYASSEYQEVATAHIVQMDRLMDQRGGPGRIPSLKVIFRQATRLEEAFWQMGWQRDRTDPSAP